MGDRPPKTKALAGQRTPTFLFYLSSSRNNFVVFSVTLAGWASSAVRTAVLRLGAHVCEAGGKALVPKAEPNETVRVCVVVLIDFSLKMLE
jgi:hypothetical protein